MEFLTSVLVTGDMLAGAGAHFVLLLGGDGPVIEFSCGNVSLDSEVETSCALQGRAWPGSVTEKTRAAAEGLFAHAPQEPGPGHAHVERGLTVETLVTDIFAPAARRMGEQWARDACSFSDVTVGVGRLKQALLRVGAGSDYGSLSPSRQLILSACPGE